MGSAKEWDDFNHNHTKYEPQLVYEPQLLYHEPQLEKLRLELTIILNLEDLLKPIELDQKTWMDTLNVFNPFLGGKNKSLLGRYVGTTSRSL
jgi:hypothetical protein